MGELKDIVSLVLHHKVTEIEHKYDAIPRNFSQSIHAKDTYTLWNTISVTQIFKYCLEI